MKKSDAENGIRYLCSEWGRLQGVFPKTYVQPCFYDFLSWVQENHPAYLNFRTTTSVTYDVEMWFDQEFKQTWRQ